MFRICFGAVMFAHAVKYLYPQGGTTLKDYLYHETTFNFTYPGFAWIQPIAEPWWNCLFLLMAGAALAVALGIFFRFAATVLFLSYGYIFLSELAKYNNHYYLMCLLAFLLLWTPADRRFSISTWWKRRGQIETSHQVPFWCIFILRAQLFIVYFFGGLAKINADWLTGVPMIGKGREVLDFWTPVLNLPQIEPIYIGLFIAWFGLIFDLSIGFLLIWRRTRLLAFALVASFHIGNHFLFPIGLFPIMALSTTFVFCEPDWPVRFWRWIRKPCLHRPHSKWSILGMSLLPPIGFLLGWSDKRSGVIDSSSTKMSPVVMMCLFGFLLLQVTIPFRHFWIAGDANWTEEGQDFAWRMMLRSKDASHVIFHLADEELLVEDARGNSRIDWSRTPESAERYLFVPIDSAQFDWSHHPGLTMTYEPTLGLRAVYPLADSDDSETIALQLKKQWESVTHRQVQVRESIGFEDLIVAFEDRQALEISEVAALLARLRELDTQLKRQPGLMREKYRADLAEELDVLARRSDIDPMKDVLIRLHPFSLQADSIGRRRFLIIEDPEFSKCGSLPEQLTQGNELLVWVDLGRLRPADWERLPNWFATFEDRQIKVLWNYANDLNSIQKRRFSTCPWMIRQFAMEIANRWKEETDRRPQVFVTSNIMMNFRVPQPLIDPSVDLASSTYSLSKHNDWITPLSHEVGTAHRIAERKLGSTLR
ncbi:MAG: HTTM domain-containing protein [Planctomycetota bacterium]